MNKPNISRVPRYHSLRIYLISTLLYIFLVFPVSGILTFKYGPEWMQNENQTSGQLETEGVILKFNTQGDTLGEISDSIIETMTGVPLTNDTLGSNITRENSINAKNGGESREFAGTISLLLRLLLISFIIGFSFSLPFKIYFSRKRKGREIPPKLFRFCKKYLLKTPIITAGILFISYGIVVGYMGYILFIQSDFNEITQKFYKQFFFITVVSSILTLLFVYYWQKHRVHILYIEHIFTREELRKRIMALKESRIRNRLWVSSAMTTLLPLLIVVFYLFISITAIQDVKELTNDPEALNVLVGKYKMYLSEQSSLDFLAELFYVNAFDSLLMFAGIFSGILISFIYILFFVRWTTQDIVYPVRELLENMQRTGQGELDSFSIVRTNDEIGELTEGYNEMTQKLKDYIVNISRMNEANARFVPRQFLDYLGKESISDIRLGDQVQKEMTVLFTDIRDFTSISEQMTPKENFNFLNNYLGYMEPVIRNNNGFIDKFMGDSIMALFPENAEDAINAAIEMRIKLQEFNHIISQFGQPPINTGIGIHTGMLMLGVVGGEGRMDGTVIADAVNLSARLEGLTKFYGAPVIISEDTLIKISDPTNYNFRFLDIVQVKGKKKAVYIFEILDGEREDIKNLKLETKPIFSKAVQSYKDKAFEEALAIFRIIHKQNPNDLAVVKYIQRCRRLIEQGNPEEWDGIEKF